MLFTCCFLQAQGRPGKPFYACRSYIVSISFSLPRYHHPKEEGLLLAMPVETHKLDVFKGDLNGEPNQVIYESWGFTNNYNPFHKSNDMHNSFEKTKPHGHQKQMMSTFQKRARDVLSILIALLLGALCGAITSTIFHVVWALATHRYRVSSAEVEGVSADPKDFGYQKLPAKEGVEVHTKEGFEVPTKEGVEVPTKEGLEV